MGSEPVEDHLVNAKSCAAVILRAVQSGRVTKSEAIKLCGFLKLHPGEHEYGPGIQAAYTLDEMEGFGWLKPTEDNAEVWEPTWELRIAYIIAREMRDRETVANKLLVRLSRSPSMDGYPFQWLEVEGVPRGRIEKADELLRRIRLVRTDVDTGRTIGLTDAGELLAWACLTIDEVASAMSSGEWEGWGEVPPQGGTGVFTPPERSEVTHSGSVEWTAPDMVRAARAIVRAMGMQAENQGRVHRGEAVAYHEDAFLGVLKEEWLGSAQHVKEEPTKGPRPPACPPSLGGRKTYTV